MFKPDDPLSPPSPHFSEGWHAQALALADGMVRGECFTATAWAQALGAALTQAETRGAPDTEDTYYNAVLNALETLTVAQTTLETSDLTTRKDAWTLAYKMTRHGDPVRLG